MDKIIWYLGLERVGVVRSALRVEKNGMKFSAVALGSWNL